MGPRVPFHRWWKLPALPPVVEHPVGQEPVQRVHPLFAERPELTQGVLGLPWRSVEPQRLLQHTAQVFEERPHHSLPEFVAQA